MTEATMSAATQPGGSALPDDGQAATKELQDKSPAEEDEIGELLAELCDDTLTQAERLENQFTLSNRWTIDGGRLESRILRVLKHDPRQPEPTECDPGDAHHETEGTDLPENAQEVLARLPATESELTDHLGIHQQTVRDLISTIRDEGIDVKHDPETETYAYQGSTDDGESVASGFGSLMPPQSNEPESDEENESIYVVYWLPTEDVAVEEFEKPVPWSPEDYKFVRLVEAIGYGAGTIDQIEGESVVLDRDDGDDAWSVPDPEEHDIHPAAYTTNPVAPPGTSVQSTLNHVWRAVAPKVRGVTVNRYTLSAAAFAFGAVTTYALYVVGVEVGAFMIAFPEMMTDFLMSSVETSSTTENGQANAEAMVQLMETMMSLMLPLIMLSTMFMFMKRMMVTGRENRR